MKGDFDMSVNELITSIFQVCILPLFGIITTFLVKWFQAKMKEIKTTTDDAVLRKYMDMLEDTITDCVIATNQAYVDNLKGQNAFTKEAQEQAFKQTKEAILTILSKDAQEYLNAVLGDLNAYIEKRMETEVYINKPQK